MRKYPKCLGLSAIALVLAVAGAAAQAQQPAKVPRIGYLTGSSLSAAGARTEAFRQGLRELGYLEGKNIIILWRSWEGKLDQQPAFAADLARLKVDVIVTGGLGATGPAKKATATIPIVMTRDSDPVANGLVASLARPGGNITGLSDFNSGVITKRLELLKEVVPTVSRRRGPLESGQPHELAPIEGSPGRSASFGRDTVPPRGQRS